MFVANTKNLRLVLDGDVADNLKASFQQRGMSDSEGYRRLFAWFTNQDEVVQASLLGAIPTEIVGDIEERIVEGLKAANSNEVVVREVGQPPTSDEQRESANEEAKTDTPATRKPAKRGR